MKKFIFAAAAAAATVAATPAAAQSFGHQSYAPAAHQASRDYRDGRNVQVNRNVRVSRNVQVNRYVQATPQRRWNRGERFDRRYATNYRVIQSYPGLYAAPRGYQWVRSGNDAVLVSIASGLIGALIANLF